jgi:hypothetical protein
VPFVERNHVIEQIAATTPNPAFRNSILPRTLVRRLDGGDLHRSYGKRNFQAVFGIAVGNQKAGSVFEREGLSQLLHDPDAGGMLRTLKCRIFRWSWSMTKKQ